ncbi:MAG TPA: hypothetical protein VG899_08145 [Mycobacteriales bacterium]|nr:hypothetical protein [Mycobacteriales bacterium]
MTDSSSGPRPGARDNGLRCAGYVAAGDLDPRVADALLDTLRSEGIAAYASPTPASRGGYLELRLPDQLTDRVYVDAEKSARAMQLFAEEQADATQPDARSASDAPSGGTSPELDVDAAWQQLLTSLRSPTPAPTWPDREDVAAGSPPVTFDEARVSMGAAPYEPLEDDDHYVPPAPPPLPKLRTVTLGALAAIIGGIAILVTGLDGGDFAWLGWLAIIGGGAALVWYMKDRPPNDSGWDDGAVV